MPRERITESALLEHIRERLRRSGCRDCVPSALGPIKPVAGGTNWQVLEHPACSDPCQARMLETCVQLAERYDVDWPEGRGAAR